LLWSPLIITNNTYYSYYCLYVLSHSMHAHAH